MKLKDKVALVTGGGSGIGREICLTFAREGALVGINDINGDAIEGTIKEMGADGARALALPADVSDSSQVKKIFADLLARFNTIDILVNNAGIGEVGEGGSERLNNIFDAQLSEMLGGGPVATPWLVTQNLTDEEWDRMLRVHLYGTFHCSREALKVMEAKKAGKIVNMSSVAATMGLEAAPHYSAAKAGILGFTRSLAREVGAFGINVNAIAPGYIDTPMTAFLSPMLRQSWIMNTPLKKIGYPKDVAAAALYLSCPESDFLTGQIISPNGGTWMP